MTADEYDTLTAVIDLAARQALPRFYAEMQGDWPDQEAVLEGLWEDVADDLEDTLWDEGLDEVDAEPFFRKRLLQLWRESP